MTIVPEWLAKQATKPPIFYSYNTDNDGINTSNNDGKDTIKDGTEDVNRNGRIDGDNGDGIWSESETWTELDPNDDDTDGDSFKDDDEQSWEYNPLSKDTDSDGLNDNVEDHFNYGTKDSNETSVIESDTDKDGLSDKMESDGWTVIIIYEATLEIKEEYDVTSDPFDPDSDDDGINDLLEYSYGSNPNVEDTDNDGIDDNIEVENNLSPTGIDGDPPELVNFNYYFEINEDSSYSIIKLSNNYILHLFLSLYDYYGVSWLNIRNNNIENIFYYSINNSNIHQEIIYNLDIIEYSVIKLKGFNIILKVSDDNNNIGEEVINIKGYIDEIISIINIILNKICQIIDTLKNIVINIIKIIIENVISLINFVEFFLYQQIDIIYCHILHISNLIDKILIYFNDYYNYLFNLFGKAIDISINKLIKSMNIVFDFILFSEMFDFINNIVFLMFDFINIFVDNVIQFIITNVDDYFNILDEICSNIFSSFFFLNDNIYNFIDNFSILTKNGDLFFIDNIISELDHVLTWSRLYNSDAEFQIIYNSISAIINLLDIFLDICTTIVDIIDTIEYILASIATGGALTPLAIVGIIICILDIFELMMDIETFFILYGYIIDLALFWHIDLMFDIEIKLFGYIKDFVCIDYGVFINWTDFYLICFNIIEPTIAVLCSITTVILPGAVDVESLGISWIISVIGFGLDVLVLCLGIYTYLLCHPEYCYYLKNITFNINTFYKKVKTEIKNDILNKINLLNKLIIDFKIDIQFLNVIIKNMINTLLLSKSNNLINYFNSMEEYIILFLRKFQDIYSEFILNIKNKINTIINLISIILLDHFFVFLLNCNPFPNNYFVTNNILLFKDLILWLINTIEYEFKHEILKGNPYELNIGG